VDSGQLAADSGQREVGIKQWAVNSQRTVGSGQWRVGAATRPWPVNSGQWAMESRHWLIDSGQYTGGSGEQFKMRYAKRSE
jgi:hypothetical protein